jgi:DNA-binding CsgD family transcriptional regulator
MIQEQTLLNMVEKIYEAGCEPSLWPGVLLSLQELFSAENIVMGLTDVDGNKNSLSLDRSVDFEQAFQVSYNHYYFKKNIWADRAFKRGLVHKGAILDPERVISLAELKQTEIFNDWIKPQHLLICYAPVLSLGENTFGLLSLARGPRHGTLTQEERRALRVLTPHLVRAVDLHRRIGALENARALLLEAADRFFWGLVFLDTEGDVIFYNKAAGRILTQKDGMSLCKDGRIAAWRAQDTAALRRLVLEAVSLPETIVASNKTSRDPGSMTLPRPSGKQNYSVTVCPVRLDSQYGHNDRAHAVLFVDDPEKKNAPPVERLKRLYGLTAAEAEVAAALCLGKSLDQIVDEKKRSKNTIKTLLQRIFHKTGTSRQSELLSLLLKNFILHIDGRSS